MQRIEGSAAKVVMLHPARPVDPRDRQDVGHRGDEAPDFGQDYGNTPEIERPAEPPGQVPPPEPPRPGPAAAFGASSGETWAHGL
jgi:hypothetical protein